MKFKDYLAHLNQLLKENPDIIDLPVVYAKDSEGNGYEEVIYSAAKGVLEDGYFTPSTERPKQKATVVCIN